MNSISTKKIQHASQILWDLLLKYQDKEPEADLCLKALEPLFKKILRENIIEPTYDVPCGYYFHEGALKKYPDLEEAYSHFAILVRGQDPSTIQDSINSL